MAKWMVDISAIDPNDTDGERWKIGIHEKFIMTLAKNGHEQKLARLNCVKQVLEDTRLIVQGWSRPDKDECFVYCGLPDKDFKSRTIEVPPPPGMLFLVFVLPDGTIDDWVWRKADSMDITKPEDINGEIIWKA